MTIALGQVGVAWHASRKRLVWATMTAVQFQFHGEALEMIDLAVEWAETYDFRVAAERFFPDYRNFRALRSHDVSEAYRSLGQIDRLALRRGDFDLTATRTHWFVERNADCLFLSVDWPADGELRESWLEGATEDDELLRTWRRILRGFKASMHQGASVRGMTGMVAAAPAHRHTAGAHALAEQGTRMLAVAGTAEYLFNDLSLPGRRLA